MRDAEATRVEDLTDSPMLLREQKLTLSATGTACACAAGMLTPDGRCKTLDAAANGYVRSEGVGMLVLRGVTSLDAQRAQARRACFRAQLPVAGCARAHACDD